MPFLALSPPCKPCPSTAPVSSKKKKKNGDNETTTTTTSSPKTDSPSHVGILLTTRNRPSAYHHNDELSYSFYSESNEYFHNVIALASHLLIRGHSVTVVVGHHHDNRILGDNNNHNNQHQHQQQQKKKSAKISLRHANRIYQIILDHLNCEDRASARERLEIRLYQLDDDRHHRRRRNNKSSVFTSWLFGRQQQKNNKQLLMLKDSISLPAVKGMEHIFSLEPELHALIMDYTNVAGMIYAEFYKLPSIQLLHHGKNDEMMFRKNSRQQFKSFLFQQTDNSNTRTSSSSFLSVMWWQTFLDRVHTSWLEFQLGSKTFIVYNILRRRSKLTILRRFLPDVWQAPGSILVHIVQQTTTTTPPLQSNAVLPEIVDDMPNFISLHGPVVPLCFPCHDNNNNNNTNDQNSILHPPCLLTASSLPLSSPLSRKTRASITSTTMSRKKNNNNIILLDDSLPYDDDITTLSMSEQVQKQFAYRRKLLHAMTLARESVSSWQYNNNDDGFDIIRVVEESERDQDSNSNNVGGGGGGDNSESSNMDRLLVSTDQENRELEPAFLKSHVATTLLDAISYYSHSPDHYQLALIMTNRCHESHHHQGTNQYQQQQEHQHNHHQHWLMTIGPPVLCINDDDQETVRQLALRILRKLHQRDQQVVQEEESAVSTTTDRLAKSNIKSDESSSKDIATMHNDNNNSNEELPPILELVQLIEEISHVRKHPRFVWKTGRQLGAELLERVVVPWNNRKRNQHKVSTAPLSPEVTPGLSLPPSHQPPPLLVSMSWFIVVSSMIYLFLQRLGLVRLLHRSSQRVQHDDAQRPRHDASSITTNGTNHDSDDNDLSPLLIQGFWQRLSQLDLALQMLQDWVRTELEEYHQQCRTEVEADVVNNSSSEVQSQSFSSSSAVTATVGIASNRSGTISEEGGGSYSATGLRKRKNAKKSIHENRQNANCFERKDR